MPTAIPKTEKLMVYGSTPISPIRQQDPEGDFVSSIYTSDGVDMISSSRQKLMKNSDVLHGMILDFVYENDLIQ